MAYTDGSGLCTSYPSDNCPESIEHSVPAQG
jgi:hypothetical protein